MFYAGGVEKIKYALWLYALEIDGRELQTMYCSLLHGQLYSMIHGKCSLMTGRNHSSLLVCNHKNNLLCLVLSQWKTLTFWIITFSPRHC